MLAAFLGGLLRGLCQPLGRLGGLELEESIREKDALLGKSLERVTVWEERFSQLKRSQGPLLFKK